MAKSYLVDSNVIIDYLSKKFSGSAERKLDNIFNELFHFSIISRMEVLGFNAPDKVLEDVADFLLKGNMHYVTDQVSDQTIAIRRIHPKLKLPDAIVAATALVHSGGLLTRNTVDFKNILNLTVVNPWDF